ncbi:hypothetical protein OF83DRAFT_1088736, partial [Amylostereum chailletii]
MSDSDVSDHRAFGAIQWAADHSLDPSREWLARLRHEIAYRAQIVVSVYAGLSAQAGFVQGYPDIIQHALDAFKASEINLGHRINMRWIWKRGSRNMDYWADRVEPIITHIENPWWTDPFPKLPQSPVQAGEGTDPASFQAVASLGSPSPPQVTISLPRSASMDPTSPLTQAEDSNNIRRAVDGIHSAATMYYKRQRELEVEVNRLRRYYDRYIQYQASMASTANSSSLVKKVAPPPHIQRHFEEISALSWATLRWLQTSGERPSEEWFSKFQNEVAASARYAKETHTKGIRLEVPRLAESFDVQALWRDAIEQEKPPVDWDGRFATVPIFGAWWPTPASIVPAPARVQSAASSGVKGKGVEKEGPAGATRVGTGAE